MSLLVCNEGEVQFLKDLLGAAALETMTLRLYKTNVTPAETDTTAVFTIADFTNYVDKTLTRTTTGPTWSTPASGAPTGGWSGEAAVAEATYNGSTGVSWTCGATGNTIYGYWVFGNTSTKLLWAELFTTARVLANGDTLTLVPRLGLA